MTMARRSIALAASFIIIISGFNVFAADSETSDNSNENTAVEALTDTTGDDTVDSAGIQTQTVSVLSADELLADTIISSDEETGIAQLANIIPDLNLRTEVWRSLAVADQLGDPADPQYTGLKGDELYKAVLQNFTGTVYASGYVKVIRYHYSFQWRLDEGLPPTEVSGDADTRDEAVNDMNALIAQYENSGAIIDTESVQITSTVTITENKKPDEELIENIEGIQWLRKAEKIDISSNKITSLEVLDYDKIKELQAEVDGDSDNEYNGMTWFGNKPHDTIININENPITTFPENIGGALSPETTNRNIIRFYYDEVVCTSSYEIKMSIDIPEIFRDDEKIELTAPTVFTDLAGLSPEYEFDGNTINLAPFMVDSSVQVSAELGCNSDPVGIYKYGSTSTGVPYRENLGFLLTLTKRLRVLNLIEPEDYKLTLTLDKAVTGGTADSFVPGAVYQLFKVDSAGNTEEVIHDGNKVTGETDGEGSITLEMSYLPPGDYCLQEVDSPDGYKLNDTIYPFSVGNIIVEGGTSYSDDEAADDDDNLSEEWTTTGCGGLPEEGKIYIDRYSPDITLKLDPETANSGQYLSSVTLTYYDSNDSNRKQKTETFTGNVDGMGPLEQAENYINTNKGNDETPGTLYGPITVQPIFQPIINAENEQKVTDFTFDKLAIYGDERSTGDGSEETPLKGAEFTLTCNHDHKENDSDNYCTDLHIQKNPDLKNETGCDWFQNAQSDENGEVTFTDLVIGSYTLKETEAPIGYEKSDSTWTVIVYETPEGVLKTQVAENIEGESGETAEGKTGGENESDSFKVINKKTVPFSFIKTDDPKTPNGLAGAEFTLYPAVQNEDGVWIKEEGEEPTVSVSSDGTSSEEGDVLGLVDFGDMAVGTYILEETQAPPGYITPGGRWIVELSYNINTNTPVIVITPEGDVPEFDDTNDLTVSNEKGAPFSFIKTGDAQHPGGLPGAVFTLYPAVKDEEGNWEKQEDKGITRESSDKNEEVPGLVDFGELPLGTYILEETQAPPGYVKPSGYWIVTIGFDFDTDTPDIKINDVGHVPAFSNIDKEVVSYQLENHKIPDIPSMGGKGTFIFAAGGILLMGCAIILFINLKKSGRRR